MLLGFPPHSTMLDHWRRFHRMGTCFHLILLFLIFTCHRLEADFTINGVTISFHPGPDVTRNTNVSLICRADVSRSAGFSPKYEFHIEKDNSELHRTAIDADTYDYPIREARVADTGDYRCRLFIQNKSRNSQKQTLTVTGALKPRISVDRKDVREDDEVTATCSAPGERGSFIFYFYVDNEEVHSAKSDSNEFSAELPSLKSGSNNLTCKYSIGLYSSHVLSMISDSVTVLVRDIGVSVSVAIIPSMKVTEADSFTVTCDVRPGGRTDSVSLIKGVDILTRGNSSTEYRKKARAADSGEYVCRVEIGGVVKLDKAVLTVEELFSKPTLTRNPPQAFEGDYVALYCKSTHLESLSKDEIKYSIFKDGHPRPMGSVPGQMTIRAGPGDDGNYSCKAEAKSIIKESEVLVVRSKVLASTPDISVKEKVILGKKFTIHCKSNGTLPITYTLFRDGKETERSIVHLPDEEALFSATIDERQHIGGFRCRAQNHGTKHYQDSKFLKAFVVEPLRKALLTTLPVPLNVEEGVNLTLICNVASGTPPITFKWYSTGRKAHLHSDTVNTNHSILVIPWVEKLDSGEYYCIALNAANNVESQHVNIEVKLATWKKALIVAICLLVVAALVVVVIVRYKAKRGKRETTTELSVKPASPKSDDTIAVTMSHDTPFLNKVSGNVGPSVWTERPSSSDSSDGSSIHSRIPDPEVEYTEVVHPQPADPARVPLKKGTDTVYSELQTAPLDPSESVDNGVVEYAELNHDLPEPVD